MVNVEETKKWMFHVDNQLHKLPYVNARDYALIKQSIKNKRFANERVLDLQNRGFEVRRCYVPTYNGVGNLTYMARLNEIRIIVARPTYHHPREVFAVIIKAK